MSLAPFTVRTASATSRAFASSSARSEPKSLTPISDPNTGREHIDAVDDRLCPDIRHARQGNSAVHRALELRKGHARSPLIPRLEMHDLLRHVQPSRIGRSLRARYLCRDIGDFRKALQYFVLPLRIRGVLRQRDARIRD